ncbi:MAG: UDP-N-acetylmuramoyl-L-alanine--D-glutamate ligase, partial [Rhodobacterales bacterium]|nr:UDP-N-acetylmuramoyl-L-alanine--D-glutamate ligase [Rhodobacterales bacterium]
MIPLYPFAGWTVAVLGLDAAGIAAGRALVVGEATVWGWDDDPARRAAAEAAGVPIHDLATANWSEPVTLVVSTAVPHGAEAPHPVVARARAVQCEVINDIELLARARPQALYLGVTGVTGSAETARLLGHLLSVTGGA